ncbi:MAG: acyl carrier protein [Eggerthellaceae bacterium]|nr:acyl carrier protein [Eggerthellaceae bacterium]
MAYIDTIKEILQDNLNIDPETVSEASTFDSLNIDSLDLVELICEIEDRLDIEFGEPEGLATVADLVEYLDTL